MTLNKRLVITQNNGICKGSRTPDIYIYIYIYSVLRRRGRASAKGYVLSRDEALLLYYTSTEKLCCLSWDSSYSAST